MGITLNEIGYSVAHSLGQPDNFFLREKIKLSAVGIRAMLIRQDLTRNTLSKQFLQSLGTLELECVDAASCPTPVPSGTKLLRTKVVIPEPVRTKDDATFYFVGTIDKTRSFQEAQIDTLWMNSEDRFTSKDPRYYYLAGYVYVIHPITDDLEYITIVSPFADPRETASFSCDGQCYSDDSDFPLSMDMWYQMEQLLITQYGRSPKTLDEEVRINEN